MFVAMVLLLIVAAVMVHELGHALLMRRYGVEMREICLFGMGPKLVSFGLPRWFGNAVVTLRLLPLGAFVAPRDPEAIERLPHQQREHVYGGGIAANLIFAALISGFFLFRNPGNFLVLSVTTVCLVLGLVIWKLPRIGSYVILLLGVLLAFFTVFIVINVPLEKGLAGPVGVGQLVARVESYNQALLIGGVISLDLAVLNALPLLGLDGGHILFSLLERHFPQFTQKAKPLISAAMVLGIAGFLALVITGDILRAWHMF